MTNEETFDGEPDGYAERDGIGDTRITLYANGNRKGQAELLRRLAEVLENEEP